MQFVFVHKPLQIPH